MLKKLNLKFVFVVTLLLVLSFTINSVQAVEITFWSGETEEQRQAVIREMVSDFEAENPDISVEIVPIHESNLPDQIMAAIPAQQLPDVIELGLEHVLLMSNFDLLDVDVATDILNNIGIDDYFSGPIDMTTLNGNHLAVPMHGWVQGIWYRQDWFDEAGLDAPETWDSIAEAAEYFYNPPESYGIVTGTKADHYARQSFNQFAFSNNAYLFDEDGNINFDSPEMLETVEFYKELVNFAPPGPQDHRDGRSLYMADQLAMVVYSSFFMGTLESGAPELIEHTGFAPRMVKESEAVYGQFQSLGVPVTSSDEEKEAAQKLIEFMLTGDNYIDYLHMAPAGMLPVRESVANNPDYRDHEILNLFGEQHDDILAALEVANAFGFEHGQIFPQIGDISAQFVIGTAFAEMIDQDLSPEEVVERIQNRMMDIVD